MKKILSMAMAAAMVASMAATSFAVDPKITDFDIGGSHDGVSPADAYDAMMKGTTYDDKYGYPIDTTLIGPFGYHTDDKNMTLSPAEYGKTAYFLLTEYYGTPGATRLVQNSDSVDGLKVKGDWEEGKSLVDGLAITKKKVMSFGFYKNLDDKDDFTEIDSGDLTSFESTYGFVPNKYYYTVAVSLKDSSSTNDADVIGDLILTKSKPKADKITFGVGINVDWEQSYRKEPADLIIDGDTTTLYADTYYALKFDYDDEIDMNFSDDSIFTVDVSGQSKMIFYFDTNFVSSIANKYPMAELNFWNGNGAKFNRTGELFLSSGEGFEYIYQIQSDGTRAMVNNATYDDGDEGFYFKTRELGRYVFSDIELDLGATESTEDAPIVVAPVEPVAPINPGTGAIA